MARQYGIVPTTEINVRTLCTFVFAIGDSRYYTRVSIPSSKMDSAGVYTAVTLTDIIAFGDAIASANDSLLLSVMVGCMYENDNSLIPNGDSQKEKTYHLLMATDVALDPDVDTTQLRIPNLPKDWAAHAWFDANLDDIILPSGKYPGALVNANAKDDRRAKASV